MDLLTYVRALRKGWYLVVVALVLGGGLGYAATATATPAYASRLTFYVSATGPTSATSQLTNEQFAANRAATYAQLLTGTELAGRVKAAAGLPQTPTQVSHLITATVPLNTVLIDVVVQGSSPQRAQLTAQAVASTFPPYVQQLERAADASVFLSVTTAPTYNASPVSPRRTLDLLIGLAVGAVVGVLAAVLRELFDTRIRTPQSLAAVADLPTLGTIDFDPAARRNPLLVGPHLHAPRAEAFRRLRTNLKFANVDHAVKSVLVTSAIANEGKSSTAANLALALAEDDVSVLLIDADLRRPRIADYLEIEGGVGLTDVLAGDAQVDDVLQPWSRNLTVLPSGAIPPNPSQLLGSDRMTALMADLRGRYDIIILDTPPLVPVVDAAAASPLTDGVIVVARYRKTRRHDLGAAIAALRAVDAPVLGFVLTMRPEPRLRARNTYSSYVQSSSRRRARSGSSASRASRRGETLEVTDQAPSAFESV